MKTSFFGIKKTSTNSEKNLTPQMLTTFTDIGIETPLVTITNSTPSSILEQAFYWQQLEEEGIAYVSSQNYWVLPWSEYYALKQKSEHQNSLKLLNMPVESSLKPIIRSNGALSDSDFSIVLDGWKDTQDQRVKSPPNRTGGTLSIEGKICLLNEETWQLAEAVRQLYKQPTIEKNHQSNELAWSKIRRLAIKTKAGMDDFLRKTIVLSPETLKLDMRRNRVMDELLVELQPTFENAPANWLQVFDDYHSVQNRYSVSLPDGGIAHILVSPEVKEVLHEIKQMPHRRVTGERARALLRNPYTQLGEQAANHQSRLKSRVKRPKFSFMTLILKYKIMTEVESTILCWCCTKSRHA